MNHIRDFTEAADTCAEKSAGVEPLFIQLLCKLPCKGACSLREIKIAHFLVVFTVYPVELCIIEHCLRFAETFKRENLRHFIHGEELLI